MATTTSDMQDLSMRGDGWRTVAVRERARELEAWADRLEQRFGGKYTVRIEPRSDDLWALQVRPKDQL